MYIYIY